MIMRISLDNNFDLNEELYTNLKYKKEERRNYEDDIDHTDQK